MLFYITILFTLLLGALLTEGIFSYLLHINLKDNRQYIYTYLLKNENDITLEEYTLKTFFPKYFVILLYFILSLLIGNSLPHFYSIILYTASLTGLIGLRVYNRHIFNNIWQIINKV